MSNSWKLLYLVVYTNDKKSFTYISNECLNTGQQRCVIVWYWQVCSEAIGIEVES